MVRVRVRLWIVMAVSLKDKWRGGNGTDDESIISLN